MMKKWIDMDRLADMPEITEGEAREALEAATGQVLRVLPRFTSRFPRAYSENGFYPPADNVDWTRILDRRDMAGIRIHQGQPSARCR